MPRHFVPDHALVRALSEVCADLAIQLITDAEGASHDIRIEVDNAATEADALEVARQSRATTPPRAFFGNDPNWGRILAAVGTTSAAFEPDSVDVAINGVTVCRPAASATTVTSSISARARRTSRSTSTRARRPRSSDQRPHPCLCPRELRLQHVSPPMSPNSALRSTTDTGADFVRAQAKPRPRRGPPMDGAIARCHSSSSYGGNAMTERSLQEAFAQDVAFMRLAGCASSSFGGGPQISRCSPRLGMTSEFKGGLRVTTPEVVDVVRMVLTGRVGRELVGLINQHGPSRSASGEDARALRRPPPRGHRRRRGGHRPRRRGGRGRHVRRGRHHRGAAASPSSRRSPPDLDADGQDSQCQRRHRRRGLAVALGAGKLVVPTDVEGVGADWPDRDSLLSEVDLSGAREVLAGVDAG